MFTVKPNPTFKSSLTLVGQGREQVLNLVYRHKPRDEYLALLESARTGDLPVVELLLDLVESWEADAPFDADVITQLQKDQSGADWAIVSDYTQKLMVARKEN